MKHKHNCIHSLCGEKKYEIKWKTWQSLYFFKPVFMRCVPSLVYSQMNSHIISRCLMNRKKKFFLRDGIMTSLRLEFERSTNRRKSRGDLVEISNSAQQPATTPTSIEAKSSSKPICSSSCMIVLNAIIVVGWSDYYTHSKNTKWFGLILWSFERK